MTEEIKSGSAQAFVTQMKEDAGKGETYTALVLYLAQTHAIFMAARKDPEVREMITTAADKLFNNLCGIHHFDYKQVLADVTKLSEIANAEIRLEEENPIGAALDVILKQMHSSESKEP